MQKVLIVTYYWPPCSGAGVQRWLKFSKYLPQHGWEPVILTVDPRYATFPAIDNSLLDDIPPALTVYKTRATDYFRLYRKDKLKIPSAGFANDYDNGILSKLSRFIRGNFFLPDPRRGWNRPAFTKACEIIEKENIIRVITTSPPHSTQIIGLKLKKRYPEIRWIADLRDPWTDIYYYDKFYPTLLSKKIDRGYEKKVLKDSDRIITVGNSLKKIFSTKYPGIEQKMTIITNGYDEPDFENTIPIPSNIFTISYIGTLSDDYPLKSFLVALKLAEEVSMTFRLRFVGSLSSRQKQNIISLSGRYEVEFIDYSNHSLAISYMIGSNLLLLIIPEHRSSASIITGKLFEYLASRRPVICIGPPEGDAAAIINEAGAGKCFDYNDTQGISSFIRSALSGKIQQPSVMPEIFSRRNLALKVAETLT
jgi:glycosyltransferase involved in cell wall biosynthesis